MEGITATKHRCEPNRRHCYRKWGCWRYRFSTRGNTWNKERKEALTELRDGYLQQNSQSLNPEKAAPEPLQGNNRGKGRPKKPFKDLMRDDPDGCKLQKIRKLMQGKIGKGAALVILACIKKGWIDKPTYRQVSMEFGNVGVQQGFTQYLNERKFSKEELDGAINALD